MTRRKATISRQRCPGQFAESTMTVPFPRWLQRRLFHDLRQVAHCRIDPDRARRAREIIEQIEAKKGATRRRSHIGQTAAIMPPAPAAVAGERQLPPERARHGRRTLARVKHWGRAAARHAMGIYSHIHGRSIAGQLGPGRRSRGFLTH